MDNRSSFGLASGAPPLGFGGIIPATAELAVNRMHDSFGVSGNGTINSLTSLPRGGPVFLYIQDAPTFTHSTKLLCPGSANYTAMAGDIVVAKPNGDGVWRLYVLPNSLAALRANNLSDLASASTARSNLGLGAAALLGTAVQSDQETATSTTTVVTPGRQHFHPGMAKAWIYATYSAGVPTNVVSYNVSSITDNGVGDLLVNFTTGFSSASYSIGVSAQDSSNNNSSNPVIAVGSSQMRLFHKESGGVATDPAAISGQAFGDFT